MTVFATPERDRGTAWRSLAGIGCGLAGVLVLELVIRLSGFRPASPAGLPMLAVIIGGLFWGLAGGLAAAAVVVVSVLAALNQPGRFAALDQPAVIGLSLVLPFLAGALTGGARDYFNRRSARQLAAEEALRASEARFKSLTDLTSDWYWEQDDQLRFVAVGVDLNQQQSARFSLSGKESAWENPTTSLSEEQWLAHRAVLAAHEPFQNLEYSRVGADGERRWVSVSGAPIFDAGGRFTGYRGVVRDISARKRAEQLRALEHAISRGLAEAHDAATALQSTIRAICVSENWQWGKYWRLEDAAGVLRSGEFWAPADASIRCHLEAASDVSMGPGVGLSGHVLRSGEPLWVVDVLHDPRVLQKALVAEIGVHGAFLFPVKAEEKILGVLSFSSPEVREPDEHLSAAVQVIGGLVGQFLRRMQAEEDLRRFRVALDHSADMILLIDRTTMRYVDVNETACRLLGYTRAELVGMGPQDVLPVSREALERSYDALLAKPSSTGSRLRSEYLCKDGSTLPFESTRHVIRSGDGYLIVAISRDIRDRLAAEDALRDSEARFRAIFEHSNAGIAIWDMEGRYLGVNQAQADYLGYSREELLQRTIDDTRSAEEPQWKDLWNKMRTGSPDSYTRDRRYRRKDGTVVWGRISVAPVRDADGQVQYFTSICTDITEARQTGERIARLNEGLETRVRERTTELEALVQELESFTYTISHDLRAPLRAMNGFAQIMLQDHAAAMPPDARRMLTRIHANARRMSDLVDGLLAFARLGRGAISRRMVSMQALAEQTWTDLAPDRKGRDIELEMGDVPLCEGDSVLLKQVWANLLSNAVKYTRDCTPARIAVGWEPVGKCYFVRDNGAGFDMQYADKLFGVFSRLHADDEFEGTGLGLAICARILRRHGGNIHADAKPGAGATFYFSV